MERQGKAALSGSKTEAPGSAGGYLLCWTCSRPDTGGWGGHRNLAPACGAGRRPQIQRSGLRFGPKGLRAFSSKNLTGSRCGTLTG